MVELSPKEVQKNPEERMGRQLESAIYVGGEENTLTLPWLQIGFIPREPC